MARDTTQEKEKFFEWLDSKEKSPATRKELAKELNVSTNTLLYWEKQRGQYDSVEFLTSQAREVDEALIESCKRGQAQSLRTYFELTNKLKQPETNVQILNITADDIDRIRKQARIDTRADVARIREMCD